MQGKSLRVWKEIFIQGKPCMLKCHVNPVLPVVLVTKGRLELLVQCYPVG